MLGLHGLRVGTVNNYQKVTLWITEATWTCVQCRPLPETQIGLSPDQGSSNQRARYVWSTTFLKREIVVSLQGLQPNPRVQPRRSFPRFIPDVQKAENFQNLPDSCK